ncbi:hypothetical protein ADK88_00325 [Streptomyces sp. NRRL F-2295]|nr:hypothetical protein ADK88_00325 [Streptomyces sp. NRRL F-2295]
MASSGTGTVRVAGGSSETGAVGAAGGIQRDRLDGRARRQGSTAGTEPFGGTYAFVSVLFHEPPVPGYPNVSQKAHATG